MKKVFTTTMVAASIALASFSVTASEFKPAVAYDTAGKFDKSFNQAVFDDGVTAFTKATGIQFREYTPSNDTQREQGLEQLARRGFSPIIVVGFNYSAALAKVAPQYSNIDFVIIDSVVEGENIKSMVFAEHEGAFLVGALAALNSKTNTVGFVGGMDIPLIRKFACGYEQGAKYVNNDITVLQNMIGSTPAAFSDLVRGTELAKAQFSRGVDVVFAAAGGAGNGVYQAAQDEGKFAIGVDSNQNYLHPGVMLTSMVKRVGHMSYSMLEAYQAGEFTAGIEVNGLANGGVTWALDDDNRAVVSAEHEAQVNAIAAKIIAGEVVVHDYLQSGSCQY
ncbi:MAG: BMP family ABC transporter substrate-binding protein [Ferrimonas sp.]